MSPAPAAPAFAPNLALDDPSLYKNRELSWLEFNQRVLDQALDDHHPLLERVKFLAIVSFEPRRVLHGARGDAAEEAARRDRAEVHRRQDCCRSARGDPPRTAVMMKDVSACWAERLRPELEEHGIRFLEPDEYTPKIARYLASYFGRNSSRC
jgi:polyphosphate kinase